MWVLDAGLLTLNARCIKYNKGHCEVKVDESVGWDLWIFTLGLTSSGCQPHTSSIWSWSGTPKVCLYNTFLGGLRHLNSLGDIYGLRKNDILCKPMENGELERDIPTLSKRLLIIEVWQALLPFTRHLITSIRMPDSTSGKSENPLMFSIPRPEEPMISKIQIINQDPSYGAIRLAQSLIKKHAVHMGSLSQFNWRHLGLQVGDCFNSLSPNVSSLLGPLCTKYVPKKREKVMR